MKNTEFSLTDVASIGCMTFGFIFGAGNLIFAPLLGFNYGYDNVISVFGFVSSTSVLCLLALLAFAFTKGDLTKFWPRRFGKGFIIALYLLLGPLLAGPRNGIVSFEMGLKPLLLQNHLISGSSFSVHLSLFIFTLAFFALALRLSLSPVQLITSVGKIISPLLLILIAVFALPLFYSHFPSLPSPALKQSNVYIDGFMTGYNTLDAATIPVFGIIVFDTLRKREITNDKTMRKTFLLSTFSAPVLTALIYFALCYVGLSVAGQTHEKLSGAQILLAYTQRHFGEPGEILLGLMVFLACLSTAIGFIAANGEYFNELFPRFSYRQIAVFSTLVTLVLANIGLTELTKITVPVLNFLYPILVALIVCGLVTPLTRRRVTANYAVTGVTVLVNLLYVLNIQCHILQSLPLFSDGLGWITPMLVTLFLCLLLPENTIEFDPVAD